MVNKIVNDRAIDRVASPQALANLFKLRVLFFTFLMLVLHSGHAGDANVNVGGIGGNQKTGPLIYDGGSGHLPALKMKVNEEAVYEGFNVCKFENNNMVLKDVSYPDQPVLLSVCHLENGKHNQTAWLTLDDGETRWRHDEMNGGYSPSLDAFYAVTIAQNLYQDWYGLPILKTTDGTPMQLTVRVHYGRNYENAFWDGKQITFGDGGDRYYPMTALDMTVHEMSHGFTDQHSNVDYSIVEMAALHEFFSDAAAMAAEYYVTGKNTWAFGSTLVKGEGAIRYINDPKKNGAGIDHMKDFNKTEPHKAAGIMNKAFYLIAISPDWNTKKAFDVVVKANMDYWTASTKTLNEAACGILAATNDYHYNVADVKSALMQVGLDVSLCK